MNWLKIFATFLIFIVIIGGGAVVYQLFFQDIPQNSTVQRRAKIKEVVTTYEADLKPNLSDLEHSRQDNIKQYQTKSETIKRYTKKRNTTAILTITDLKKKIDMEKLSLENIDKRKPKKNIYNREQKKIFKILKALLLESSQRDLSSKNIVLNSSISSILRSKQEKDRFFQLISQKFGMPIEVVEELSYSNGYIWDWIRELTS